MFQVLCLMFMHLSHLKTFCCQATAIIPVVWGLTLFEATVSSVVK